MQNADNDTPPDLEDLVALLRRLWPHLKPHQRTHIYEIAEFARGVAGE
jgi:hypothetical protein